METSLYSQVHQWCSKKYKDYVVFTKSILFILGLILSYKLVEKTFLNILIAILSESWNDYDFRKAVIVVNLQEGTASVLAPVFAYAGDVHTGRFNMLVISGTVCIIGLVLNCLQSAEHDAKLDVRFFYPALVLMSLAQAAQTVTLQPFLEDQLRGTNGGDMGGRRSRFWWTLVSFVAAIFVLFGPLARLDFRNLAISLAALMGGCFFVFLLGSGCYTFGDLIENPFKDVKTVILGAISKTKLDYPRSPRESYGISSTGDPHIVPIVPWLRWLDKAVVQVQGTPLITVEQVRGVKLLSKMLPLWLTFLTLSLVAASGSTFFFQEAISLSDSLTPILFFSSLQRFVEFLVSHASSYIIGKLRRDRYNKQMMELMRIGIGLSCCVLCCIASWVVADQRMLHEDEERLMSVYLLTPQYVLLGITGGLCQEGLLSFYNSQVHESLFIYGPPFWEFMMGVGKFMCMLCILIFSLIGWFNSELAKSRLDRYYIFLAVLSFANLVIYWVVAVWYGGDIFLIGEDGEMENSDQTSESTGEGHHISHQSHVRRTVSVPEGISSSEDAKKERPERPLLTSVSINSRRSFSIE